MHPLRNRLHEIIHEADTPAGKVFDVALLIAIIASIAAVMLESVYDYGLRCGELLRLAEWVFTVPFTIEYILRLLTVQRPSRYALSFFGIIDFLAVIPTYLSLFIAGSQYMLVVRALRLVRVFRVLKLSRYVGEGRTLATALRASRHKITVFVVTVLTVVTIVAALMYLIGGEASGFTSIPKAAHWAVVTMTTVGYGDIAPQTPVGQFLAAIVMFTGYAIIAVPTGIVSVELANASRAAVTTMACPSCSREGHDVDAAHCKHCGDKL